MPRTADEPPARTRRRSARARSPALSGIQTRHEPARPVRQEGTRVNDTTSGADLAAKKLPELQAMAAERGIKGARRLRKGELIEALRGGAVPASTGSSAPAQSAPAPAAEPAAPTSAASTSAASAPADTASSAPEAAGSSDAASERPRTRSRSRSTREASTPEATAPDLGIELPDRSAAREDSGTQQGGRGRRGDQHGAGGGPRLAELEPGIGDRRRAAGRHLVHGRGQQQAHGHRHRQAAGR